MENGFALDAYHVPKCGAEGPVHGGTMPKASNEAGSLFTEVKKNAKLPGPDYYNKEGKPFGQKAPLGQFSRIARDDHNSKKNWPAVGQYETITPVCTPRTRGGIMAKSARGCLIYDQAVMEGKWKPAPGKYDPQKPEKHVDCLAIAPESKEDKQTKKKGVQLGPGYYSPNFDVMEKRQPAFAVPKQDARANFISKDKDGLSRSTTTPIGSRTADPADETVLNGLSRTVVTARPLFRRHAVDAVDLEGDHAPPCVPRRPSWALRLRRREEHRAHVARGSTEGGVGWNEEIMSEELRGLQN
ncbi:unnamed protein product [Durusdinium trenchii]|uniref:Flagellar associated protein n=1 Tax=Durusdinium trenchii TaxID=1381693 RepID=A0ABP0MNU2_9DINO